MKTLLHYYTDHHLLTIGQIIDRWSDAEEPVLHNYKDYVAVHCNMAVHQPLYYYQAIFMLAYAMADFEAGEDYPYRRLQELGYRDAINGASTSDALPLNA